MLLRWYLLHFFAHRHQAEHVRYETFCQLTLSSTATSLVQTRKFTPARLCSQLSDLLASSESCCKLHIALWRRFGEYSLTAKPPAEGEVQWNDLSSSLRRSGLRVCCQARVGFFLSSSCFDVGHSQHHTEAQRHRVLGAYLVLQMLGASECLRILTPQIHMV